MIYIYIRISCIYIYIYLSISYIHYVYVYMIYIYIYMIYILYDIYIWYMYIYNNIYIFIRIYKYHISYIVLNIVNIMYSICDTLSLSLWIFPWYPSCGWFCTAVIDIDGKLNGKYVPLPLSLSFNSWSNSFWLICYRLYQLYIIIWSNNALLQTHHEYNHCI